MDLHKRRQDILDRHKLLESVPGSGWHADDPDSLVRQRHKKPPLTERIMAIQDNDRIHFVGPCAERLRKWLGTFAAKVQEMSAKAKAAEQPEPDVLNYGLKWQANVLRHAKKVLSQEGDVELSSQDWNYIISALTVMGIHVVLAPADEKPVVDTFSWAVEE